MRYYKTILEEASVSELQSRIDKLQKLLPVLDDTAQKALKDKIAALKDKLPTELKYGSLASVEAGKTEQPEVSRVARMLAELIHEGVKEGVIQSNWRKIIKNMSEIKDKEEYEDAKYAYTEFDPEGKTMDEVLDRVAMRDNRFYPRYYEQLQRLDVPHKLVYDARQLRGQTMSGSEWDRLFAGKYNSNLEWKGSASESMIEGEQIIGVEETYHGNDFFETYGDMWFNEDDILDEAEYQGRKVQLGKPMRGDVKKFKVYVKDPKTGNIKKVNFGDPNMKIKKSNPARRKSFRARHNCDNPGPRTKARYWSCRKW